MEGLILVDRKEYISMHARWHLLVQMLCDFDAVTWRYNRGYDMVSAAPVAALTSWLEPANARPSTVRKFRGFVSVIGFMGIMARGVALNCLGPSSRDGHRAARLLSSTSALPPLPLPHHNENAI